ncbi:MAG TPA: TIGR02266 family protein [Labilithrix sp.]|nr:TIGR02266 family protein [Labilithrix sp.]
MGLAAVKMDVLEDLGLDTRAEPRAAVYASVDLFSENNFWSGLTMNMSDGGVFVATHNVVPVGTVLVLNLLLPFEKEPVITLAQVRWSRAYTGQADVPPGLGLQFVDTDTKSLAKIRKFVATMREPLFYDD